MTGKNLKKYKEGSRRQSEDKPCSEKKQVITVIVVILCIGLASALFIAIPKISELLESREEESNKYYFYPVIVDENIYADKYYLQLDRNYYFEDPSYGTTVSFDPDSLEEVPEDYKLPVSCIVRFLDFARDGECEKLKDLYSDIFYKNGYTSKTNFTPQKIYEAKITYYDSGTVSESLGTWSTWYFWVEYKIYKNNGTFRDDMESDCSRKELFQLTYRDGTVEIDAVTPYRVSN